MRQKRTAHQPHLGHCPLCGYGYEDDAIEVLRRGAFTTILHAECSQCQSAAILAVISGMMGMVTTLGMLTDMSRSDITRFWTAGEITADDVLNAHVMLESKMER